jgi:uncharacterized membrane protein YbhN (UPF0104 family)
MWPRLVFALKILAGVVFVGLALAVLGQEFSSVSFADVVSALGRIGWGAAGLMALAVASAYTMVATYDAFALGYAGRSLSLPQSALSSTVTYAISNLLGFPLFTGNAVRFWLFESWGKTAGDVAIASVATTIVCNIALGLILGLSLIAAPELVRQVMGLNPPWGGAIGLALIVVAGALVAAGVAGPRTIKIHRLVILRPGPMLVLQLVACALDYAGTAMVLYLPLAENLGMGFPPFLALFSIAKLIGIFSNVPGGLGVFEAVMATTVGAIPAAELAAALLAYRAIFYLVPFGIAAVALAVHALARPRRRTAPRQPTPSS